MANKTINIGGRDFTVAPLNLKQIRAYITEASTAGETPAQTQRRVLEMCAASITNGGAAIAIDELEELLTVPDFKALQSAVLAVSELVSVAAGENQPVAA